ncbi:MAG: UDP-N-acetylmuramate--L-alanine ligase [Candidatus Gracilibacteria bacterium]
METNFLEKSKKIHFVGIGGIGVSALAQILLNSGKRISGSDTEESALTKHLENAGAKVLIGHNEKNIDKNVDLVVRSLAIPDSNPEIKMAHKLKIPILTYPQAVGELTRKFYTIAICGTHGKSTITAMVSKMLIENGFDPTVIIGTKIHELGNSNFRIGKSKILVLEACEYMRAFLNYQPKIIILNNLEPDHLDYYKNFEDYMSAFDEFAQKLPKDGFMFANLNSDSSDKLLQNLLKKHLNRANLFTYSNTQPSTDYFLNKNEIINNGQKIGEFDLQIPGEHNRINALAAIALGIHFGITPKNILKSLNAYRGAFRRFEIKGHIGKTVIIDDYAHHPTEIRATLEAVREKFPKAKVCVIFQPHQYSRTRSLLKDFGTCFEQADKVIIPNIYRARDSEKDVASVSPEHLVEEINKNRKIAVFGDGLAKTLEYTKKETHNFGVIITMGAGDVWQIADGLIKQ